MTRARSIGFLSMAAFLILSASFFLGGPQAKETDAAGCKDHPLFTRTQSMHIVSCELVEFDRFVFKTGKGTEAPVEGKRVDIKHQTDAGNVAPSPLAIIRNHQQAIATIGGTVQHEDQRYTILKATKDGKEIWAQVDPASATGMA
jgi:OmpA-OmpF porin, OOP family